MGIAAVGAAAMGGAAVVGAPVGASPMGGASVGGASVDGAVLGMAAVRRRGLKVCSRWGWSRREYSRGGRIGGDAAGGGCSRGEV